jgi:pyrroline-5-carboxylate reductase
LLASAVLGQESTFDELINKIASKKGTTEAALNVFKSKKMEKIIETAVFAAAKRAGELSNG